MQLLPPAIAKEESKKSPRYKSTENTYQLHAQYIMKRKKMDVLLGLSYGIGLLLIGAAATVYWGNGNSSLALWLCVSGTVWIILTGAIQTQFIIIEAHKSSGGVTGQRAVIGLEHLIFEPWVDERNNLIGVRIGTNWKNFGDAPARNARAMINYQAWPAHTNIDDVAPDLKFPDSAQTSIPAQTTMLSTQVRMPLTHLTEIYQGKIKGFLFLRMEYNDGFHTEISGEIQITKNPVLVLEQNRSAIPDIIQLRIIGKRNSST